MDADQRTGKTGDSTGWDDTAIHSASLRSYLIGEDLPLTVPAVVRITGAKAVWRRTSGRHGRASLARGCMEYSRPPRTSGRAGLPGIERSRGAWLSKRLWEAGSRLRGSRPAALELTRGRQRQFIQPIWRSSTTNSAGPVSSPDGRAARLDASAWPSPDSPMLTVSPSPGRPRSDGSGGEFRRRADRRVRCRASGSLSRRSRADEQPPRSPVWRQAGPSDWS